MAADNASANDVMVRELGAAIEGFSGPGHQIRCFAHILNLVAKTIISQFDTKSGTAGGDSTRDSAAAAKQAAALAEIVAGLDMDSVEVEVEAEVEGEGDDDELDDEVDAWIDERCDLSDEEKDELRENVLPLKLILAKVSRHSPARVSPTYNPLESFESSPTPSSTRPPNFSPPGRSYLRPSSARFAPCRAMSPLDGIPRS